MCESSEFFISRRPRLVDRIVGYFHGSVTNSGVTCSVVEKTGFKPVTSPPTRTAPAAPTASSVSFQMT